ncbi:hypothetical protein QUW08_11990 [Fournierella massiliensis]|uniref:Uncharacterized protein n=1 Tax=Allofournierella massiliensis TaxID=1650663 RepID=A0ABT7USY8_9FIRM|nr:hypothetical protein [Fournierella massiliensis]MDM8202006.1 hypothetical protein [Fournierella massiliensis]
MGTLVAHRISFSDEFTCSRILIAVLMTHGTDFLGQATSAIVFKYSLIAQRVCGAGYQALPVGCIGGGIAQSIGTADQFASVIIGVCSHTAVRIGTAGQFAVFIGVGQRRSIFLGLTSDLAAPVIGVDFGGAVRICDGFRIAAITSIGVGGGIAVAVGFAGKPVVIIISVAFSTRLIANRSYTIFFIIGGGAGSTAFLGIGADTGIGIVSVGHQATIRHGLGCHTTVPIISVLQHQCTVEVGNCQQFVILVGIPQGIAIRVGYRSQIFSIITKVDSAASAVGDRGDVIPIPCETEGAGVVAHLDQLFAVAGKVRYGTIRFGQCDWCALLVEKHRGTGGIVGQNIVVSILTEGIDITCFSCKITRWIKLKEYAAAIGQLDQSFTHKDFSFVAPVVRPAASYSAFIDFAAIGDICTGKGKRFFSVNRKICIAPFQGARHHIYGIAITLNNDGRETVLSGEIFVLILCQTFLDGLLQFIRGNFRRVDRLAISIHQSRHGKVDGYLFVCGTGDRSDLNCVITGRQVGRSSVFYIATIPAEIVVDDIRSSSATTAAFYRKWGDARVRDIIEFFIIGAVNKEVFRQFTFRNTIIGIFVSGDRFKLIPVSISHAGHFIICQLEDLLQLFVGKRGLFGFSELLIFSCRLFTGFRGSSRFFAGHSSFSGFFTGRSSFRRLLGRNRSGNRFLTRSGSCLRHITGFRCSDRFFTRRRLFSGNWLRSGFLLRARSFLSFRFSSQSHGRNRFSDCGIHSCGFCDRSRFTCWCALIRNRLSFRSGRFLGLRRRNGCRRLFRGCRFNRFLCRFGLRSRFFGSSGDLRCFRRGFRSFGFFNRGCRSGYRGLLRSFSSFGSRRRYCLERIFQTVVLIILCQSTVCGRFTGQADTCIFGKCFKIGATFTKCAERLLNFIFTHVFGFIPIRRVTSNMQCIPGPINRAQKLSVLGIEVDVDITVIVQSKLHIRQLARNHWCIDFCIIGRDIVGCKRTHW